MKLWVEHVTRYVFDSAALGVIQSQRLYPTEFAGQVVLDWTVETSAMYSKTRFVDGAGDVTETVTIRGPIDEVTVRASGTVETTDLFGVLRGFREKARPSVYLRHTSQTRADAGLRALSAETLGPVQSASVLDQAHALSAAVSEHVAYKPGTTETGTSAAEALAGGEGVCADQAHVLIALAHCADIPARYVAGYLEADAEGRVHEASHAWAELFIEDLGWVGFDPTNLCCPDDRYIRLCSGFDAFDAAPIRGIVQGTSTTESLDVQVIVTSAQQQQEQ